MSKWTTKKLIDFWEFNPKIDVSADKEYSFIEMPDLEAGNKCAYPSRKRKAKGLTKFQNEDTLFAKITPCLENGKICQAKGLENNIGVGSTEFFVFRGKHGISDNDFIHYLLKWYPIKRYAEKCMSGSAGHQRVPADAFDGIEIPLPDYQENKEIGKTLSLLDDKIALLRQQNQALEELAQTIFKQWFVEFEFPDENGNPYKSSGGKMVESELGEIPDSWVVRKLRNEISATKGLSYKGAGLAEEGTVMHSLKSISEGGGYRHDGIKYYNAEYKERHVLHSGDVVVANTEQGEKHMLIGYPARIPHYVNGDSIFTHHLTKVERLPDSTFTNEFIYYSLMSKQLRHQIISYTNGTTVNGLPTDGLLEPIWIIPTKKIIVSFTQLICVNWQKQENNYEEIHTLTKLRDTLLPKLMSGELKMKEQEINN